MRRLLPVLLLAACGAPAAQSPVQAPAALPPHIEQRSDGYEVRVARTDHPSTTTLDASVDRTWKAALEAFDSLGLPLGSVDSVRHQAQGRVVARRALKGTSLASYFDCGNEVSGAIADSWRLTIESQMGVAAGPTAGSSVLGTYLTVRATPVEGTSTSLTQCASRGTLEARLADTVRAILAAQK